MAPNTGPATRSLFTGYGFLEGRELSTTGSETLAEMYSEAGFVAASFSSNPHLSPSYGLTRGFERVKFLPLEQDHGVEGEVTVNDSADRIHAEVLHWLDWRARQPQKTDETELDEATRRQLEALGYTE